MNTLLVAQLDFVRSLDGLSGPQAGWQTLLIVAGAAVSFALGVWLLTRWFGPRERRSLNSPAQLLSELAAAHGLKYAERKLLTRMARHLKLAQPALLFVEPALWSAGKLGPTWDRARPELDALHKQLFSPA